VSLQGERGPRVIRVAEATGVDAKGIVTKDIFTYSPDGEGSFSPTGAVPKIATELASRGLKVDAAVFKRR
jgi:hypothetical protein